MSYFRREKKAAAPATKSNLNQSTVHAVVFGFHRGNKSTILVVAQMDTHGHRLLHEIDRSDPHEARYQCSHHPISGDKHLIEIWMSHQDHSRQHGCIQF
jgi:hypothetical protein